MRVTFAFAAAAIAAGCSDTKSGPSEITIVPTEVPISTATRAGIQTGATATPSPSAASTGGSSDENALSFTFASGGGSQFIDTGDGYSGTLVYPANNSSSALAELTIENTLQGTQPAPAPDGTIELCFTLELSSTVTLSAGGLGVTPITLTAPITGIVTETLYDQTTGIEIGSAQGQVNGQTVTFGQIGGNAIVLNQSDVYLFEISQTS